VTSHANREILVRKIESVAMKKPDSPLALDSSDAEDKQLSEYGRRITTLLQSPEAEKNNFLVATLDDFLGVVYALIFAKHNNPPFEDRSGAIEPPVVLKRAREVESRSIRTSGTWLAGFHFNSALFRIAATYHRGLKVVLGKEEKDISRKQLLEKLGPAFQGWKHDELDAVYEEVNHLKHEGKGLSDTRSVTWAQAQASVSELIELFELWTTKRKPPIEEGLHK
jgi:hypothetical protein